MWRGVQAISLDTDGGKETDRMKERERGDGVGDHPTIHLFNLILHARPPLCLEAASSPIPRNAILLSYTNILFFLYNSTRVIFIFITYKTFPLNSIQVKHILNSSEKNDKMDFLQSADRYRGRR